MILSSIQKLLPRDDMGRMLARGASGAFVIRTSGLILSFLLQLFLARILGPDSYGIYIYVLSWIIAVEVIARLGMDVGVIRFVSGYLALGKYEMLKGILSRTKQWVGISSFFWGLVIILAAFLLRQRLDEELYFTFLAGSALLPVSALCTLQGASLQGLKKIFLGLFPNDILRPLLVASILLTAVFLGNVELRAHKVMLIVTFSAVLVFMALTFSLRRSLPGEVRQISAGFDSSMWFWTSLPYLLSAVSHMLNSRVDILMIGALVGAKEAGWYATASRLAGLMAFGLGSANTIAAPMIAGLWEQKKTRNLQRLLWLTAAGVTLYTVPLSVLMLFGGKFMLGLFGQSFVAANDALFFLVIGQIVNALSGPVGVLLAMTGHQRVSSGIIATGAVLNIVLNAILIPKLGLKGAAIATGLCTCFWNICMFTFAMIRLKLNTTVFNVREFRQGSQVNPEFTV